jgi:hypothetical protein
MIPMPFWHASSTASFQAAEIHAQVKTTITKQFNGMEMKKIVLFLTEREEGVACQCSSLGLFSCLPEGDPKALSSVCPFPACSCSTNTASGAPLSGFSN